MFLIANISKTFPLFPTGSNAFAKLTKTIYRGRSCSMHFSWSCRRQKIVSTTLRFERSRIASLAPPLVWCCLRVCSVVSEQRSYPLQKKRYTSVITTLCSVSFAGILPRLWYIAILPYVGDTSVQSVGHIGSHRISIHLLEFRHHRVFFHLLIIIFNPPNGKIVINFCSRSIKDNLVCFVYI